ncbi:MAG: fluoride efflux transporter CrcB, partial [Lacisediminihabitans sp.]
MSIPIVIAVLVAGAVGALLRYLVALAFAGRSGFPSAVLVVNVVGSALSGALLALATLGAIPQELDLIIVTGLCGGLTTFSTWTVETMQLIFEGRVRSALSNVWLNLVLGIAAATLCYFAV